MPINSTYTYERCCIICGESFVSKRMNTIFCSTKCRNKSRSFPPKFLEKMISKANQTVVVKEGPSKAVLDYMKKQIENAAIREKNGEDIDVDSLIIPGSMTKGEAQISLEQAQNDMRKRLNEQRQQENYCGTHETKYKSDQCPACILEAKVEQTTSNDLTKTNIQKIVKTIVTPVAFDTTDGDNMEFVIKDDIL